LPVGEVNVEAAMVADPAGVGALGGELHAAANSTIAVISAARSAHAERPSLPLLRTYGPATHMPPA
jgi:hypothetical protein